MQTTNHILLVKPARFSFNNETALSNTFQSKINEQQENIQNKVLKEFENFAAALAGKGIDINIIQDTVCPIKPDAIFPNNWITFHKDGIVIVYPMYAPNRRPERGAEIIEIIKKKFVVNQVLDLSHYEEQNRFLEGTGSIVFDHTNKIAYACFSPRTDKELFIETCDFLKYRGVCFHAEDIDDKPVYHTNVMMCIAEKLAVICLETITKKQERKAVIHSLLETDHEIVDISIGQMKKFAGNMLQLKNTNGKNVLVMSESAFDCLTVFQKEQLENDCEVIPLDIKTIETIGGGSVRCMIAEIFLTPITEKTNNGKNKDFLRS